MDETGYFTVQELIEFLQTLPPDKPLMLFVEDLNTYGCYDYDILYEEDYSKDSSAYANGYKNPTDISLVQDIIKRFANKKGVSV